MLAAVARHDAAHTLALAPIDREGSVGDEDLDMPALTLRSNAPTGNGAAPPAVATGGGAAPGSPGAGSPGAAKPRSGLASAGGGGGGGPGSPRADGEGMGVVKPLTRADEARLLLVASNTLWVTTHVVPEVAARYRQALTGQGLL